MERSDYRENQRTTFPEELNALLSFSVLLKVRLSQFIDFLKKWETFAERIPESGKNLVSNIAPPI